MKTRGLTEFFVRQPLLYWSAVAAIVIGGVLSFIQMPKLEDPAVAVKQAAVVVVWPGASAHDMELKVAQVMEDQLRTLPGVDEIQTECQRGMAQFTVKLRMDVLNEELEQRFDLIRRKANDVKMSLPQGCYDPIVVDDMMDVYGLFYGLTADGYDYTEMERYAKLIRRELLTVEGVKRINIVGTRSEVINVTLSKDKLSRSGLLPMQVMMGLQNACQTVNAGRMTVGEERVDLQVSDAITSEAEVRDLLIKTADGKMLRLGDIADVERTYQEPQMKGFFVNTKPALALCITLQDGVIVPDVGKAVDKKLAEVMAKQVPAGFATEKVFFQPDKVNQAIGAFMVNLLESVLIVIIVLMFTMGFRSGLIIGVGLALTIGLSFPILLTMGSTLQRISLGAFIIAMGMLVDNAIVIMDGILIDKQRGLGPKTYLYRIGDNTAIPLLGATIIAISAFLPAFLSQDSAGEYCRDLFLVICVSLLASWVLALVQVPMCAKLWLPARPEKQKDEEQYNSRIHRIFRKILTTLLGYKTATIATAVVLLVLSIAGMKFVKNMFFPDFDYAQVVMEYDMPPQTSPDRVRHDLQEIAQRVMQNPEVKFTAASMSGAPARYSLVRPMHSGGDNYGELTIECADFKTVNRLIDKIQDSLRRDYPDATIRFRHYNFSVGTSHPVEVQFRGPDPAVLRRLCSQAEEIMRGSKYVDAYTVGSNWQPRTQQLVAQYAKADALRAGIERTNVADALQAATDGLPVGVVYDGDRQVVINMKIRNENGTALTDLTSAPVWTMPGLAGGGTSTPLSAVVSDFDFGWDEPYVLRINGERTMEAQCDPDYSLRDATPAKVVDDIREQIEQIEVPDGYTMRWAGEAKSSGDATTKLLGQAPFVMFIILTILLLLFRSWKQVILILLCLPFIICGITPALLVFRQPFTFMAIIGLLGLVGMMVKNGIVLVDEINRLRYEEKRPAYEAVVAATISRVRPVIMASATTILGMAPLLGDPMYGSMAICIMSGLAVGTLITLVLLPILYSAFFHVEPTPKPLPRGGEFE